MYPTSKSSAAATIFETPLVSGLGKRLGVPFTRAQLQEIYVHIPSVTTKKSDRILTVEQSGMGELKKLLMIMTHFLHDRNNQTILHFLRS